MKSIDRRMLLAAVTAAAAAPAARAAIPVAAQAGAAPPTPPPPPPKPALPPPETIPLWPGPAPGTPPAPPPEPDLKKTGAPGHKDYHLKGIAAPALFAYRPKTPNGAALIVMPGGGYAYLSMENEGSNVARLFAAEGYTVFVLGYRLPGEGWTNRADAPSEDGQRAIRLVRAKAKDFAIDPARIGVIGFSAGGHLAASLATGYDDKLYTPVDAADTKPARPNFVGLLYAVTTLRPPETHSGSHQNLLGPDPTPALVDRRSPILHMSAQTPPCFVCCALDDKTVDPSCSLDWIAACRTLGVPVEGHLLERGGHGFGVKLAADNPGSLWPQLFKLWAARHGG